MSLLNTSEEVNPQGKKIKIKEKAENKVSIKSRIGRPLFFHSH